MYWTSYGAFRMNKLSRQKATVALIVICVLQIAVSLFFAGQKNYLFFDEVFSYPAANGDLEQVMEENIWLDESWFLDYMSVDKAERFNYTIPYQNQVSDVHPPLFYMFLHTACSMVPEEFSYMAGIAFNIAFFVGCTIGLYFLGKELFGSQMYGLLRGVL